MPLKRTFCLTLSFFFLLWGLVAFTNESSKQIEKIDNQIQELQEMKRGFESRALRHDNQAERLKFEDQAVLETRRHLELADENRAKAAAVQEEIDRLEAKKQQLLRTTKKTR